MCSVVPLVFGLGGDGGDGDSATTNLINVNTINDFPTPSGGVSTLEDGKNYHYNTTVTRDFKLLIPDGVTATISGLTLGASVDIYTGTGNGIEAKGNGILYIDRMVFVAPNGTALYTENERACFVQTTIFDTVVTAAEIRGDRTSFVFTATSNFNTGIISADRPDGMRRATFAIALSSITDGLDSGGTLLDVSGKLDSFGLGAENLLIPKATETALNLQQSLKDNNARVIVNTTIFDDSLGGTIFAPDSLEGSYFNANFSANVNVSDSSVSFDASVLANGLTTTIAATNTPVPVNARLVSAATERFAFQDRCTFVAATDIITTTLEDGSTVFSHLMVADDVISFHAGSGGVLPTGIVQDKDYFVLADTASTLQFSETKGGSAVDFSTNGSGIIYYRHTAGDNALAWFIYTGNESIRSAVSGDFSLQLVGGGTNDLRAIFVKSDTSFSETIFRRGALVSASSSKPQGSGIHGFLQVSKGEGLRLKVENLDSTSNIDVTALSVIVTH